MTAIRRLEPADAEALMALRRLALATNPASFSASPEDEDARPLHWWRERLAPSATPEERFVLGAFDGVLAGMVGFYREEQAKRRHVGKIWGMYVKPSHRRLGLGRALIAEVVARARCLAGLEQVQLGVTSPSTSARALYESIGFAAFGNEPRAVRVGDEFHDEAWMALDLRR